MCHQNKVGRLIINHPSSIIHHPSYIIHHPSSTIIHHHHPSSITQHHHPIISTTMTRTAKTRIRENQQGHDRSQEPGLFAPLPLSVAQAGPTCQAFYDGLSLGKSPLNGPFPFPGRVPVLFLARLAELLVDLGPGLLILTLLLPLIILPGPTWPWFGFVYARVRPPWPSWFWLVLALVFGLSWSWSWFLVMLGPWPRS